MYVFRPGHLLLDTSWCALHCEDSFFCSQPSLIAWSPLCRVEAACLPVSCVLTSCLGNHLTETSWVQPQIPGRSKLHDPLALRSFCLLFTFFFDNKSQDLSWHASLLPTSLSDISFSHLFSPFLPYPMSWRRGIRKWKRLSRQAYCNQWVTNLIFQNVIINISY